MKKKFFSFGIVITVLSLILIVVGCAEPEEDPLPTPPTEVRARLNPDGRSILVTWNESIDAKRYDIAFRTEFESESTRRSAGSAFITSYTHRPPSNVSGNDPVFVYYVRAASRANPSESGNRESAWSPGFEVGSVLWTSAYSNISPSSFDAERDGMSIRITWDRIPGAVLYELQYSNDNESWSTIFSGRPSDSGASTITRVHYPEDSGTAYYRVRASNSSQEVDWRIVTKWSDSVEAE